MYTWIRSDGEHKLPNWPKTTLLNRVNLNLCINTAPRNEETLHVHPHHKLNHVLFAVFWFLEVGKVRDDHHVVVFDVLSLDGLLEARDADVDPGLVLNFSGGTWAEKENGTAKFDGGPGKEARSQ